MRRAARIAGAAVVAALASGCLGTLTDTAVVGARAAVVAQIRLWNAMGVDPWQASPEVLRRMEIACLSAQSIVTVWNPAVPSLDAAGLALCEIALVAAAPGAHHVPHGMPGSRGNLPPLPE